MNVKAIKIQDYTYELPDERIAKYPLDERDASKLLIFKEKNIAKNTYRHIGNYIANDSLMLFNNTKVIPARLNFQRATGANIEIFCLEPVGELTSGMLQKGESLWVCMVGNAKKWKDDETLSLNIGDITLTAQIEMRSREGLHVRFEWQPADLSFAEILQSFGQVPLPPYLNRDADAEDRERYQTIYARFDGSVAAPTAGLHFTDRVFEDFKAKNIENQYVTLHVGSGTFKPVKAETIGNHDMHAEYFDVSLKTIEILRGYILAKKNVIAVGTTTLRTLESTFLMGCKLVINDKLTLQDLEIKQWDAYNPDFEDISPEKSLEALAQWIQKQPQNDRIVAKTQLLIAPPYRVRIADAIVTNFHQPQSTLLLLVAAMIGDDWRKIYDYALKNDFRFLSYGDGSILFKQ